MKQENSLLDINPKLAGFRLKKVEIYNWGGFNKKIHTINLDSKSSLLTGKNGCGKTTVIDSILTILVPNVNYNQASEESSSKKERDETTYVLGKFGQTDSDENKYLRKDRQKTYSVLLATFYNSGRDEYISLVQVRYFTNSLQKKICYC